MSLLKQKFGNQESNTAAEVSRCQGLLRQSAAHRIRLGLTGLAAIFLLVMVATAGVRPSASIAATESQPEPAAEPLAVLGVAPGAAPVTVTAPAQTQQAALQRQRTRT